MILISHRGNINGRMEDAENHPEYIEHAINLGYNVEIDLWKIENNILLGHDKPEYVISYDWLKQNVSKLWIHCKNIKSIEWLGSLKEFNYFWHENDVMTLTSKNYIWSNIGYYIENGITVSLDYKEVPNNILGVCSDYISLYKNG